ncbi:MAG: hypothetical protein HUJ58_03485 [Erysipelotrichaceae bacterium]|nr:hypothetical protein [Erysipelotrichaceae bacterium]
MKLYVVGPLFTEAEQKQRLYEGKKLREFFAEKNREVQIDNPIEFPLNGKTNVTAAEIYTLDYKRLSEADIVFFDLSNSDSGSCVALGLIMEKKIQGKDIKVYPVIGDLRLARNGQGGYESSLGFNSMMIGILTGNNIPIYPNFEEAFEAFTREF